MIPTQRIGDFFELATARLTLGEVIGSDRDNGSYCPDVRINEKSYAESKACGDSGRVIMYEQRVRRETEWCEQNGVSLHYFIWKHNVTLNTSIRTLRHDLAKQTKQLVIISHDKLFSLTRVKPAKCINKRNPPAYQQGWFINYTDIRAICNPVPYCNPIDLGQYQLETTTFTDGTHPKLYSHQDQKLVGKVTTNEAGHLQLRRRRLLSSVVSTQDQETWDIPSQVHPF